MIFVTVGSQTPFDRLIKQVDYWANRCGRKDILAQIGSGEWLPGYINWIRFLDPEEYRDKLTQADIVIAHAGTGIILNALELGKPLLVFPRSASLGETRNDHQVATAKKFVTLGLLDVAFDEHELNQKLEQIEQVRPARQIGSHASGKLLSAIERFING